MQPISIANQIAVHGFQGELEEFLCIIINNYTAEMSVERFLCHPKKAIDFCNVVRKLAHTPTLPDDDILLCLVNLRKRKCLHIST